MHKIISHSIPFKEILNDLSKQLKTNYTQSCEEYIMKIPSKYGSGSIKGINFKEGLGLLIYDCMFNEDVEIHFVVNQIHPLKFLFCEEGGFSHSFENEKTIHHVNVLENIIVASDKNNGHVLKFKAGVRTIINSLEIIRSQYLLRMECEVKSLDNELKKLFMDTDGKRQFYFHGHYSVQMADLFSQLKSSEMNNFMRTIHQHGIAYRLLSVQIMEYYDAQNAAENQSLLKKNEQLLIMKAATLIENNILDFTTVKKLSEQIGLNAAKLQTGFKHIYGVTVNEFVQNRRLDLAKNLIRNTDYTFSEIAYMVGLSSKSYFSKIFKNRYGITPSEIRKGK